MVNITLSVAEDTHKKMAKYSEIKWSEVARRAIERRINEIELDERILEKSKLTEKDIEIISSIIKKETLNELRN